MSLSISASLASVSGLKDQISGQDTIKVLEILKDDITLNEYGFSSRRQLINARITSEGDSKGQEILISNIIPENQAYAIVAQKNKKYLVAFNDLEGSYFILDYYREPVVYFLLGIFILGLVLLGGFNGFKALLSLLLTAVAILFFLVPSIEKGYNPILIAVLVSLFATAVTMILVAGITRKSLVSTLGTTVGVTVAGLLSFFIIRIAPLSGLAYSETRILAGQGLANNLDFQGLLAAGILLGSLGAAMDVAISIASAANELIVIDPKISSKRLFSQVMNVGKDIMGTMTNTLILAYTGSSLPLLILLSGISVHNLFNMELIITEFTAAIAGSLGLIVAIPITAFLATVFFKSDESKC